LFKAQLRSMKKRRPFRVGLFQTAHKPIGAFAEEGLAVPARGTTGFILV
jgi:hypothetical protein